MNQTMDVSAELAEAMERARSAKRRKYWSAVQQAAKGGLRDVDSVAKLLAEVGGTPDQFAQDLEDLQHEQELAELLTDLPKARKAVQTARAAYDARVAENREHLAAMKAAEGSLEAEVRNAVAAEGCLRAAEQELAQLRRNLDPRRDPDGFEERAAADRAARDRASELVRLREARRERAVRLNMHRAAHYTPTNPELAAAERTTLEREIADLDRQIAAVDGQEATR